LHTFEQAGEFDLPGKGSQAIWVLKTS